MVSRRNFIKMTSATGGLALLNPVRSISSSRKTSDYFSVHPFVEAHPEAVFIMRTDVDVKTNSKAKTLAGHEFARTVLVPREDDGIPLSHKIVIKPNITNSMTNAEKFPDFAKFPLEYRMGVNTDPCFVEGIIENMKGLNLSANQFYMREVTNPEDWGPMGYRDIAERTGADLRDLDADVDSIGSENLQWTNVPDGWIHKKIPYLWPVNAPDTWLFNISKFKAHGMGLTLCCKNHQGSIAHHYQQYCGKIGALNKLKKKHITRNFEKKINKNFKRHLADGIPRWDRPISGDDGLRMDIWATRTLDNISASPMGLCAIEGIYGRDGDGFNHGPNKGLFDEHEAWDYMTNIIIFGKDPFLVDIVGHWLGGHEPGNFGLFHLAMERDMLNVLNPFNIPVYNWENGAAQLASLEEFERTPLLTYYLRRDYNGNDEPRFHLVNENFDYSKIKESPIKIPKTPSAQIIYKSASGHSDPFVSIEFSIPEPGDVRLELFDTRGNSIDVLTNRFMNRGAHMAVWKTGKFESGTYSYSFIYKDYNQVSPILI